MKYTLKEVKKWLTDNAPDIRLIEYGGTVTNHSKFKCKKCKHIWETQYRHVKDGHGCPKCAGKARVTEKEVRTWLLKHRPDIELVKYGGGSHNRSVFRCEKCGYEWESRFAYIRYGEGGCPRCAVETIRTKNSTTEKEAKEWLKKYRPNIVLVEYGGAMCYKSKFRSLTDGYEWSASFASVKRGLGNARTKRSTTKKFV